MQSEGLFLERLLGRKLLWDVIDMGKKNILFGVGFLLLAALSVWVIGLTNPTCTPETVYEEIRHADKTWIGLAVISMSGFLFWEGMALNCLVHGICGKKQQSRGMLYSGADIYFSAITPSATGGQPASAFFMMRDGISAATTTVILLLNLVMYNLAIFSCGMITILFGQDIFLGYSVLAKMLIGIGVAVILALTMLFFVLLARKEVIRFLGEKCIAVGVKLHLLRHSEKKRERLERIITQYGQCSDSARGKGGMLGKAFLCNILQRICQSLVTVSCYLAIGGHPAKALNIWLAHIFAALGSNSVPIPGGIGATEYLLIQGIRSVDASVNVSRLALISRGISFYGCVILSIIVIGLGYFVQKQKGKDYEG